jgi:hypothetical protein
MKKFLFAATVVGAIGVCYGIYILNSLPEAFEWEEDYE